MQTSHIILYNILIPNLQLNNKHMHIHFAICNVSGRHRRRTHVPPQGGRDINSQVINLGRHEGVEHGSPTWKAGGLTTLLLWLCK